MFMTVNLMIGAILFALVPPLFSREDNQTAALDKKVQAFLDNHEGKWHDYNVPEVDGKLLYDIIIENNN